MITNNEKILAKLKANYTETQSGCWQYYKCNSVTGRAVIGIGSKSYYAYRVMWEIMNGPIPDGLYCCHKCDNPACINPDHIFLGDAKANYHDAINKGHAKFPVSSRGEANPNAKLSDQDIRQMVDEYRSTPISQSALGHKYGIAQSTVGRILRAESRNNPEPLYRGKGRRHSAALSQCGTRQGRVLHRQRGEDPCDSCVQADREYMRQYKNARKSVES